MKEELTKYQFLERMHKPRVLCRQAILKEMQALWAGIAQFNKNLANFLREEEKKLSEFIE